MPAPTGLASACAPSLIKQRTQNHPPNHCGWIVQNNLVPEDVDPKELKVLQPLTDVKLEGVARAMVIDERDLFVAVAGRREVRQLDVHTAEVIQTYGHDHHTLDISCVCVMATPPTSTKDTEQLFAGSWDGTISQWSILTGQHVYTFEGHTGRINSIAAAQVKGLIPGKKTGVLFSCSADLTLRVWEIATAVCHRVFQGHTAAPQSLAVFNNDVISGGLDSKIIHWNLKSNDVTEANANLVRANDTKDEYEIAVAQKALDTAREKTADSAERTRYLAHTDQVLCLAVSGEKLYSAGADSVIRTWDLVKLCWERNYSGYGMFHITSICVDSKGERLFATGRDGYTRQWDAINHTCDAVYVGHNEWGTSTAVDDSGNLLVGAYDCRILGYKAAPSSLELLSQWYPTWTGYCAAMREHYGKLRKFMARWTKRQLSAAWNTLYEKMLDYRAQLEEMRKVVAFMRNRLLVQSWNKWREVYADRFDSMAGVMNRWMNRAISNAFNKWREVYQEEIMLKKMKAMAARWLNRAIALAYFKWREVYLDMLEAIRRRAMGFWLNSKMAAAWNTWREWYLEAIRVSTSELIDNAVKKSRKKKPKPPAIVEDIKPAGGGGANAELPVALPEAPKRVKPKRTPGEQSLHGSLNTLKTLERKLMLEALWRKWTTPGYLHSQSKSDCDLRLDHLLHSVSAQKVGLDGLTDLWEVEECSQPTARIDLGALYALDNKLLELTGQEVAHAVLERMEKLMRMSEELQEQALAQEPTVERLSDDAEKVRYGYSFRQAKRCLGYTLTQEPDRSRMLAEFKALFIMIEMIDENATLGGIEEVDLENGPHDQLSPEEMKRQVEAMHTKMEAERMQRTKLQASVTQLRGEREALMQAAQKEIDSNKAHRHAFSLELQKLQKEISTYTTQLKAGGCKAGLGLELPCTDTASFGIDDDLTPLLARMGVEQTTSHSALPRELDQLRTLESKLDNTNGLLKAGIAVEEQNRTVNMMRATLGIVKAQDQQRAQIKKLTQHQAELELFVATLQADTKKLEDKLAEVGVVPPGGWRSDKERVVTNVGTLHENLVMYKQQLEEAYNKIKATGMGRRRYRM